MAAKLDCRGALDGGRTGIGPSHGKGDDDQEGIQLSWLREAGVFHVEATGLAVTEETLNLPASAIGLEGSFAIAVCGGDKLDHGSGGICPAAGGVKLCHL